MKRIGILAAVTLLAAACEKAPEAPATPVAETPAAPAPAAPPGPTVAGPEMDIGQALQQFDPAANHFIWVLPQGIHGKEPWVMNVTVKHKGEVKYESKIPLKPEIVASGTYPGFPATAEVVRLADGGTWKAEMEKVSVVVGDIIAKYGRGDGEVAMVSDLHTQLDPAGMQTYCVEKKTPDIGAYVEQDSPPSLTKLTVSAMAPFFAAEVAQSCPK